MFMVVYIGVVWFLAGFLTGITSFGGNILAIPLLAMVLDARDSIIFGCLSGIAIFCALVLVYRRAIPWRETIWLGAAGLMGVPCGSFILQNASSRFLLLAAGSSIALFLIWQYFAARLHGSGKPCRAILCVPFGFLSGIMMSAIGMGGPPVVLYAYLRQWGKENTISGANLAVGFIMLVILPAQWHAGMYSPQILRLAMLGAIFAILGTIASIPFERRVKTDVFRRLLLVTLAFSALMLIIRGLYA